MPAVKVWKCETPLGELEPNIGGMLRKRRDLYGDKTVLQYKAGGAFRKRSWNEFYDEIAAIGASLIDAGVGRGQKIAILSRNRREMLVLELAVMSIGAVSVPIFSEYPANQIEFILSNSDARFLTVSDAPHLDEALKAGAAAKVEKIFLMDYDTEAASKAPNIADFTELCDPERDTAEFEERAGATDREEPCLLMYTSGTTGKPKGVVLAHRNILAQMKSLDLLWDIGPEDRFLCYLPWHHSFGGIFELFRCIYSGSMLSIDDSYGRDIDLLIENFKAVKPTVYFSVPLIYQRIVDCAMKSGEEEAAIFHPEFRFCFTAAAHIPDDIAAFLEKKGICVVEGWGLTETSPCCTVTPRHGKRQPGTVGEPHPGAELGLSEEGEILVRGPFVMLGYYKNPEKTAEVMDEDGWFHTGDLGEFDEHGLVIKGRVDGVIKLAHGEKVSLAVAEMTLIDSSEYIDTAVAFGSNERFISALIFPNFSALKAWAAENGIDAETNDGLIAQEAVRDLFAGEIRRTNEIMPEKMGRIKAFALVARDLSMEMGERTPSFKVVRNKVIENFSGIARAVYTPDKAADEDGNRVVFL